MRFDLDSYFGIQQDALRLRSQRHTVIANNLANADTPGFQARDFDFRAALARVGGGASRAGSAQLEVTHRRHLGGRAEGEPVLQYRVPLQPAQDGNTVEADREQAAFAENAVRYQASLEFLGGSIRSMINVLKGGQ